MGFYGCTCYEDVNMFFIIWDKIRKKDNVLLLFYLFSFVFMGFPVCMIVSYAIIPFIFKIPGAFDLVDLIYINLVFKSIFVSLISIFFVFLISYPFAFFVANIKRKKIRNLIVLLVSVPLWSSFFVKLIGLKSAFDFINGTLNSTTGIFYVIVGIIYINLPIAIMNFYNVFIDVPKNLINASLDLGYTDFSSFFRVLIPFTKDSIVSCIFLIFIPSFTIITVADFLSIDTSNKFIGQLIQEHSKTMEGAGNISVNSKISVLIVMVFGFVILSYMFLKIFVKVILDFVSYFKSRNYKNV